MKNLLPLCFLAILIFGCSDDDIKTGNDPNPTIETALLTMTFSDEYFLNDALGIRPAQAILTDSNGEVIVASELNNGTTTELIAAFDTENETYNFNYLVWYASLDKVYISTYVDVKPHHYDLPNWDFDTNEGTARLNILSAGFELENHFGANGTSITNNMYTFTNDLDSSTDDLFISFKNVSEDFRRYYWIENVTGSTEETIEMNETTIMNDPITINTPESSFFSASLEGSTFDHPERSSFIGSQSTLEETDLSLYIPDDLFDSYMFQTTLVSGNDTYNKREEMIEVNLNYVQPDLEFEIISNNDDQVQLNVPSEYTHYQLEFNSSKVVWKVNGEGIENINTQLPNLLETIHEEYPEVTTEDFELKIVRLYNIDGYDSYSDFICNQLSYQCVSINSLPKVEIYIKEL